MSISFLSLLDKERILAVIELFLPTSEQSFSNCMNRVISELPANGLELSMVNDGFPLFKCSTSEES